MILGSFFGGAASGLFQFVLAGLVIWLALKFIKDITKGVMIAIIAVAGFLVVKGIVDWAMIASIGKGFFEWLMAKMSHKPDDTVSVAAMCINLFIH